MNSPFYIWLLSLDSELSQQIQAAVEPSAVLKTADAPQGLLGCLDCTVLDVELVIIDFRWFSPSDDAIADFIDQIKKRRKDLYAIVEMNTGSYDDVLAKKLFDMGFLNYFTRSRIDDLIDTILLKLSSHVQGQAKSPNLKIAVVDDDQMFRDSLCMHLNSLSVGEVKSFESGEALEEFGYHFDVYFIDIVMLEMSGLTVIQAIRQSEEDEPSTIIAISNLNNPYSLTQSLSAGANHFLTKPISVQSLLKHLLDATAQRRLNLYGRRSSND